MKRRESIWSYLALSIGCHLVFLASLPARIPQAPAPAERVVQVMLHENRGVRQVLTRPPVQERPREQLPPTRELPKAPPRESSPRPRFDEAPRQAQVVEKTSVYIEASDTRPREGSKAPRPREELPAARSAGSPAPRVSLERVGLPRDDERGPQVGLAQEALPPREEPGGLPGAAASTFSWPEGTPAEDEVSGGVDIEGPALPGLPAKDGASFLAMDEGPSLPAAGPPVKEAAPVSLGQAVQAPAEGHGRPLMLGELESVPRGETVQPPVPVQEGPAPRVSTGERALEEGLAPRQVAREESPGLPEVGVARLPREARPAPTPESLPEPAREAPALAKELAPVIQIRPPSEESMPSVGGEEVQDAPIPGATVRRVPPVYPMAARKLGLEGVVRLSVRIDGEGRPLEVNLAESSGRWDFDSAAMEAVAKWRFAPGREWIEVVIEFKLTD